MLVSGNPYSLAHAAFSLLGRTRDDTREPAKFCELSGRLELARAVAAQSWPGDAQRTNRSIRRAQDARRERPAPDHGHSA